MPLQDFFTCRASQFDKFVSSDIRVWILQELRCHHEEAKRIQTSDGFFQGFKYDSSKKPCIQLSIYISLKCH